jgi:hypothetical protein
MKLEIYTLMREISRLQDKVDAQDAVIKAQVQEIQAGDDLISSLHEDIVSLAGEIEALRKDDAQTLPWTQRP